MDKREAEGRERKRDERKEAKVAGGELKKGKRRKAVETISSVLLPSLVPLSFPATARRAQLLGEQVHLSSSLPPSLSLFVFLLCFTPPAIVYSSV